MGIYISKPVTDKECSDEEFSFLKCGSSSMQGWRTSQEDAHNAILDFDKNGALFAVYDGHGGHEVAEYTALHFPSHLQANKNYKEGNMRKALVEAFLTFDQHLLESDVLSLLKKMASSKKGEEADESTDSEDPDIVSALRKDANMSIDDLLASRYAGKIAAKLKEGASSESTGVSPALKPKKTDSLETSTTALPMTDLDEKPDEESPDRCKSSSISNSVCISSSNNESDCSLTKSNGESLPPKEEPQCNSDISKEESPNRKEQELTNGESEEKSSDSGSDPKKLTNGDVNDHDAEEAVNGEKTKSDLVVEGRRIVPTMLSAHVSSKTEDSPAYTGKGKSGGKGGKVKGKSVNTTTTLPAKEPSSPPAEAPVTRAAESKTRRAALDEVKRKVLSEEDLDSDDEDEDDENYAVGENLAHVAENDLDDDEDVDDDDDEDEDDEDEENSEDEDESSDESEAAEDTNTGGLECANEDDDEDDDENGISTEDDDIYTEFYAKMPDGPGYDSGCTACVALLHQNKLYVANVGDSRCVLSRAGKAVDMSVDHKPEDDVETERIIKAGGKVTDDGRVNGGLNLSRALGDHGYKMNTKVSATEQMISPLPDVLVKTITKEDEFVIIACDGIWNSLTSQEAVDFVKERLDKDPDMPLSSVCNEMFEHCLAPDLGGDGTGCDNMTCIIVSFKDKSSFAEPGVQDEEEDPEETKLTSSSTGGDKPGLNGVAFEDMNGDSAEKEDPKKDSSDGTDLNSDEMDDDSSRSPSKAESQNKVKNGNAEAGDMSAAKRPAEPCADEDYRPCKKVKVDAVEESSAVSV